MKKTNLLLITILVFAILLGIGIKSEATDTINLNITSIRPYTNTKYEVTTPNGNSNLIFKIIKNNGQNYVSDDALYCLRSGLGFGNSSTSNSLNNDNRLDSNIEYNLKYNLKTNATEVMNYYNRDIGYNIDNDIYNSILWIIDNMYLPEHKDKVTMKENLLRKAEITNSKLTDDDIEFVQQMALWYFTNYDKNGEEDSLSLKDTYVLSNATKINGENFSSIEDGEERSNQIDKLYEYFIENAKNNQTKYGTGNTRNFEYTKPEITIDASDKEITEDNNFTIVGPFEITKTEGNVGYVAKFEITDKDGEIIKESIDNIPVVYIVKQPEDITSTYKTLDEVIGKGKFYLKISNTWNSEYDLSDVNLNVEINYEKIYNTTATLWVAGNNEQPVLKVEKEEMIEGKFNLAIIKTDEKGNSLTSDNFNFSIIKVGETGNIILKKDENIFSTTSSILISEVGQEFIYEISETSTEKGYIGLPDSFKIKITTKLNSSGKAYEVESFDFYIEEGETLLDEISDAVSFELSEDTIYITIKNEKEKTFDLALRKYVTSLNGNKINDREPDIDTSSLENGLTATYKHQKLPVEVKTGDIVGYTISVYNEGEISGKVTKIIDYIPEGILFCESDETYNTEFIKYEDYEEYKNVYGSGAPEGKKYAYKYNETTKALEITLINPIELDAYEGETLNSESITIYFKVTAVAESQDVVLTNIATMVYEPLDEKYKEKYNNGDIDSTSGYFETLPDLTTYKGNKENKNYLGDTEYFYKGQEDDDDFEKLVIKGVPFDLALRKFITKVNGIEINSREPEIDTSKLNTIDENSGKKITTATYTHSKEPVVVKQGDIITYKIRVYNEGDLDGYAKEIVDYLPEGLGYLMNYQNNTDNGWIVENNDATTIIDLVGEKGLYSTEEAVKNLKIDDFYEIEKLSDVKIVEGNAKITTTNLEDEKIKAYSPELILNNISEEDNWQQSTNGTDGLYYQELEITCIVLAENTYKDSIRNIAEIKADEAVDEEEKKQNVTDRDSNVGNVDKNNYNPPTNNSTYQEDDDDYELIELRYFDLALRKFITKINEENITSRIPEISIDANGNLKYDHTKEPVYVANSDIVTYTLRVYNEGTVAGTPMEISDDIPDGLVFLPEYETNKKYEWKMYDKNGEETDDPYLAVEIRTEYLKETILEPYDATKEITSENPDYAEVKATFQVIEENIIQEDRIIINKAQIAEDKAVDEEGNEIDLKDEDSIPNKWNEGEDDQDIEKIYVKKFDLSLLKWVTQTIVTVDGTTTTTDTGFTPYDDPEPIAKVVIDKKKLNKTSVKFVYNIIITNEGEIEGYATEITDYIPEGLEFIQEDNPIWTKDGENKITTRALENTLLKPGETATIEVVFTWKKDANNLGIKTNIAEISEDYNEKGSKDVDSTPDNVITENYDKQQEDDDDKALVMLEIKTGGTQNSYIWLALVVLLIISSGIILIKKYVI